MSQSTLRNVLYGFLTLAIIGGCLLWLHSAQAPMSYRSISSAAVPLQIEIADTLDKQERGLSGRSPIPDNYGMLFVFAKNDRYGFWMKDMIEPIDIIWLADDGAILKVDASVATSTYPTPFYPPLPVKYVLETRAGYAGEHAWNTGTVVSLPAPYGRGR